MQVQLFRGSGRVFAFTEAGANIPLPEKYEPWTVFKQVELQRGVHTPGVEADECLDDIATFGVHITDAHLRITEAALGE
jgi:hypothetical protein